MSAGQGQQVAGEVCKTLSRIEVEPPLTCFGRGCLRENAKWMQSPSHSCQENDELPRGKKTTCR